MAIRYPIEALRRLAPPAEVRVGARVVAVEPGRALLADATGTLEARIAGDPAPLGAWVLADGRWTGAVLEGARCEVRSVPAAPFPVPGGEHLRLHANGGRVLANLRARAAIVRCVRAWFDERAFLEVETPLAVPSPGLDLHLSAIEAVGFRERRYLITSPEYQMKRLLAGGLTRIYQICRCFRRGEEGALHQPEFTMLEWYRVGFDDVQLMDEVEALVREAAGGRAAEWPACRIAYRDAFERALGVDPLASADAVDARLRECGIDVPPGLDTDAVLDLAFAAVVMPALPTETWVFVHDYPASQAALARIKPGTPPVAARFELFAQGLELANGWAELTDAAEQRRRFDADQGVRRRRGLPVRPIDEAFLGALERGLPDCAGVALGVDRLVAVAAGLRSVAATVAFAHRG